MNFLKSKSFYLGLSTAVLASTAALSMAAGGFTAPSLKFANDTQQSQADSGPADQIADVKAAVVLQFENLQRLALIPTETQKEIGAGTNQRATEDLLEELNMIWVPLAAEKSLEKLKVLYRAEAGQFPHPDWSRVEVVVEDWQGVQVSGNKATAIFLIHTEYSDSATTWEDASVQWDVKLEFDQMAKSWKLVERTGNRIEE